MRISQRALFYSQLALVCLVFIGTIAAIIFVGTLSDDPESEQDQVEVSMPETQTADAPAALQYYTVKAWNDGIGVFDHTGQLIRSFNKSITSLSDADRTALTQGIEVIGKEALDRLLEDLTS